MKAFVQVQPGILVEHDERVGDWRMTEEGWKYVGSLVPPPPLPLTLAPRPKGKEEPARRIGNGQLIFTGATTR